LEKARTAVAGLRRCEVCGFPVSEGRKFCLDCEKKKPEDRGTATSAEVASVRTTAPVENTETKPELKPESAKATEPIVAQPAPDAPQFLMNSSDEYESWIVSHKYTVVALAVVLVGLIVFLLSR
jgi:hypothetical protein